MVGKDRRLSFCAASPYRYTAMGEGRNWQRRVICSRVANLWSIKPNIEGSGRRKRMGKKSMKNVITLGPLRKYPTSSLQWLLQTHSPWPSGPNPYCHLGGGEQKWGCWGVSSFIPSSSKVIEWAMHRSRKRKRRKRKGASGLWDLAVSPYCSIYDLAKSQWW